MHGIGKRSETIWPHITIHPPVAQTGVVGAAQMEPPIIQHEAFHTDARCSLNQVENDFRFLVEVQCLPYIERDRLFVRMSGQRTLPRVQGLHDAIHASVGGGNDNPRRRVGFTPCERNFARQQQFTGENYGHILGNAIDSGDGVTTERRLHANDSPGGERESRGTGDDAHPLETRLAAAPLPYPCAVGDAMALRLPFILMAARKINELGLIVTQWHGHF